MPFWSSRARAERALKTDAYRGFEIVELLATEFGEKWLTGLERDGLLVGLNWTGDRLMGYDLTPAEARQQLDAALSGYGMVELCDRVAARFPELALLLEVHRADNDETLAHIFMDDVARWYVAKHQAGKGGAVKELANWLDTEYPRMAADAQNAIDVSFVESLPWPPDPDAEAIAATLGPRLRATLKEMQEWQPTDKPSS